MSLLQVRKLVIQLEEIQREAGREVSPPARKVTVAAVIANPYAGRYVEDLSPLYELGAEVATLLAARAVAALGVAPDEVTAYGKGAIVGTAGELEHGAALIHTPYFGNLVREYLHGESIICFADTRAGAGASLTIPMWHKSAAATRSHYQTITTRLGDAPRADEIVVLAAASTGPRPHPRIGDRTTDPTVTAASVKEHRA